MVYEEQDLANLAAFAALRNKKVFAGDIIYKSSGKKGTPDRGSPATPLLGGTGGLALAPTTIEVVEPEPEKSTKGGLNAPHSFDHVFPQAKRGQTTIPLTRWAKPGAGRANYMRVI